MLKETLIVPILLGAGIAGGGFTPGGGGIGDPVTPDYPHLQVKIDDGIEVGTDVKALQDGAVYYIKSYLNPNYVISLESNNITNGYNVVLSEKYTDPWGGCHKSQMFVAKKETDSYGNDAWSFSPYEYQSMDLKFSDDLEFNDGARDTLSVRNRIEETPFVNMFQTPECSVFANSFRLFPGEDEYDGSFRIGTADIYGDETDFAILDEEIEDGYTKVRKDFYDDEMPEMYHWYFEKAPYIGINVDNVVDLTPEGGHYYGFKISSAGYYTIRVSKPFFLREPNYTANDFIDTSLTLYENGPVLAFANANRDETEEIIEYIYLHPGRNYSIGVGYYNHPGKVCVSVKAVETVYSVTYASDENGKDFRKAGFNFVDDMSDYFMQMNMRNLVNPAADEILTKRDMNNVQRLQNPYFMMVSDEGSQIGKVKLNTNTEISYTDLPSMEGCELALWLSTRSAYNNSCIAYRAAKTKKAHYSIGFKGEVTPELAEMFVEYFWRHYFWEDTLDSAIDRTIFYIARELNVSNQANVSVLHPTIYIRNTSGSITTHQY